MKHDPARARLERQQRIDEEVARLTLSFPDVSVKQRIVMATFWEDFVYGNPDAPTPRGILNVK